VVRQEARQEDPPTEALRSWEGAGERRQKTSKGRHPKGRAEAQ
jgi:hypothetical protein